MPVILRKDHEEAWLDKDVSPAELIKLLEPYPEDEMKAYPVSDRVNKVSNNDAELIQPNNSEQGSLF